MARATSYYTQGAWRQLSGIYPNNGGVQPVTAVNGYYFLGGAWRHVYPADGQNTSYFLSPSGPVGALARAAVAATLSKSVIYPLGVAAVGARGRSAPAATITPNFPSFVLNNPFPFNGGSITDTTSGGTTDAVSLTMNNNGTYQIITISGAGNVTGNWGVPTTPAIGANYNVRFTRTFSSVTAQGSADPSTGWLSLATGRSVQVTAQGTSNQSAQATYLVELALASNPSVVVAQGSITIRAIHNATILNPLGFNGTTRTYWVTDAAFGAYSTLIIRSDGTWVGQNPDGVGSAQPWSVPSPSTNPDVGNFYWIRYTRTSETLSGPGAGSTPSSGGWLAMTSPRAFGSFTGFSGTARAQATYTVEIASDSNGVNVVSTSTVNFDAQYTATGVVIPPNGVVEHVVSSPATASAGFSLRTDGAIDFNVGNTVSVSPSWFAPNTTGIGNSYWVRATPLVGTPNSGSTTGVWHSLSIARNWACVTTGVRFCQLQIQIALDAAGSNIVGTGTVSISAESSS